MQADSKTNDIAAVLLRVPRDLHKRVKETATVERRSVNSQYLVYVERALAEEARVPTV